MPWGIWTSASSNVKKTMRAEVVAPRMDSIPPKSSRYIGERRRKGSLLWSKNAQRSKRVKEESRSLITTAPMKALHELHKETECQTKEDNGNVEPAKAPPAFEEGGQATQHEFQEVNLGSGEQPRPIFTSWNKPVEEKETYLKFLKQNQDVLAWTCSEVTGLDPAVAMHLLAFEPDKRLVKKALGYMHSDLPTKVEAEVDKLVNAGFITEVGYPIL